MVYVLTLLMPALMVLAMIYCAVKTVGDFRAGRTRWGVVGTLVTLTVAFEVAGSIFAALMIRAMAAGPY